MNISIKAILAGVVIAYAMNFIISMVLFSGYENLISTDITAKKSILIILIMLIQASIPAYIAAILAKRNIITHSIFLGLLFVFLNLIMSFFERDSIGYWWDILFYSGLFLFAILGGIIRKIEVDQLRKQERIGK